MHITLTEKNRDKMLKASHELNRSPNELVNLLLDLIDHIQISENVAVGLKREPDPSLPVPRGRRPMIRKRNSWSMNF